MHLQGPACVVLVCIGRTFDELVLCLLEALRPALTRFDEWLLRLVYTLLVHRLRRQARATSDRRGIGGCFVRLLPLTASIGHDRELPRVIASKLRSWPDLLSPGLKVLGDELVHREASHDFDELQILIDFTELGISGYQAAH
jgi:hypothetical protein